jgi:hypothetical protein
MRQSIPFLSFLYSIWVLLVELNGAHASSGGQRAHFKGAIGGVGRIFDASTASPSSSWFTRRRNLLTSYPRSDEADTLKIQLGNSDQEACRSQQRGLPRAATRGALSDLHRGGASGAAAAIKTMTSRQYEAFKYVVIPLALC